MGCPGFFKMYFCVEHIQNHHTAPRMSGCLHQKSTFPELTWCFKLLVVTLPSFLDLKEAFFQSLDVSLRTVTLWESKPTLAPAVILSAGQLPLWIAGDVAEGSGHKAFPQILRQQCLQAYKEDTNRLEAQFSGHYRTTSTIGFSDFSILSKMAHCRRPHLQVLQNQHNYIALAYLCHGQFKLNQDNRIITGNLERSLQSE